jgi:ABC-type antimicrobial peptide transport system permease subunit
VLGKVREAVRALDPRLPVYNDETLEQHLASTVGVERQAAMFYAGLALLAMLLALLGLYGILTQAVIERTQEIAVRAACGAGPGEIRRLILMRCLAVTLAGAAVGLAAALPVNRILENQIYGVETTDPLTWLGAAFVLLSLALLVSLSPALRAARISPSTVLRHH